MDLFVARQPIFGLKGEVAGYELLYRRGAASAGADGISSNQMSLDVVIQSFLEIGLDRITHDTVGYLNFSREMLLAEAYDLLDPRSVVIELLESIEADDEVLAACERLVDKGYRLALDDYIDDEAHRPLLPFAEIVKVDVLNRPVEELRDVAGPLRARGLRLLAERVETAEVSDSCRGLGFELFQGYFFSRPELVAKRGMSAEQASIMQLMNLLRNESVSDHEVEETFRRDPSLSYKLLRMVNSASQGGRGVESILHAIRLLGRETLHRWLSLLFTSSLATQGGTDGELVQSAVVRARLCELLGRESGQPPDSLFLVGLFSMMDALLRTPLEELLGKLDLADDVSEALLRHAGPHAKVLELVEAYEGGDWDAVSRLAGTIGVTALEIPELYLQSLQWARQQIVQSA